MRADEQQDRHVRVRIFLRNVLIITAINSGNHSVVHFKNPENNQPA